MAAIHGERLQLFSVIGGRSSARCRCGGRRARCKAAVQAGRRKSYWRALRLLLRLSHQAVQLPLFGSFSMRCSLFQSQLLLDRRRNECRESHRQARWPGSRVAFLLRSGFVIASLSGSVFVALLMAALMGAGRLLVFNFNPARIFMGIPDAFSASCWPRPHSKAPSKGLHCRLLFSYNPFLWACRFSTPCSRCFIRLLERRSIFQPTAGTCTTACSTWSLTHKRAVVFLYGVSSAGHWCYCCVARPQLACQVKPCCPSNHSFVG